MSEWEKNNDFAKKLQNEILGKVPVDNQFKEKNKWKLFDYNNENFDKKNKDLLEKIEKAKIKLRDQRDLYQDNASGKYGSDIDIENKIEEYRLEYKGIYDDYKKLQNEYQKKNQFSDKFDELPEKFKYKLRKGEMIMNDRLEKKTPLKKIFKRTAITPKNKNNIRQINRERYFTKEEDEEAKKNEMDEEYKRWDELYDVNNLWEKNKIEHYDQEKKKKEKKK